MRLVSKYSSTFGLFILVLVIFSSCGSRKNMVYFQQDSTQMNTLYEQHIPKIQPNDF